MCRKMVNILGRKQRIKNLDWLDAFGKIEQLVTKKELDTKINKTVSEICKRVNNKKAAFAWSGGKDSLVLHKVCEMADIRFCVLVVCNLEYPAFLQWVEAYKPLGLSVINTGQDMQWLAEHQNMLFPQDSKTASKWFQIVQHRGQEKYYKENNLDIILLGRRKVDGNYVGKDENIYTNNRGITRYSPLADWSHEEILAFIHYYDIVLPPFYQWENGYCCGTHPWPARQWTNSIQNGWEEIYNIDHTIVEEAAKFITSAENFMKCKKINNIVKRFL